MMLPGLGFRLGFRENLGFVRQCVVETLENIDIWRSTCVFVSVLCCVVCLCVRETTHTGQLKRMPCVVSVCG